MSKYLLSKILILLVFSFNFGYSQFDTSHHSDKEFGQTIISEKENILFHKISQANTTILFSCNFNEDHDHDHEHEDIALTLDFLSSDESTDFNCSGGFCMNESHFHKKGLTLNRQLFYYFISISC
ncbi:hypothetical protein [Aquimarina algicola]|uniref:DUF2796 domain-containing protein n=1 Tax=Aquimarina algicola TaxID=2589995 RepID=A0A504IZF0_9FLAO|nr:hypothetical protein [Aquimarina algicola]TPN83494.1 hypothetical protein FHK87_19955 [Aquimarina algicola]